MKDDYIKKFYNEINKELDGDYKIILEPRRNLKEPWIEYDQVKWEMDKPIKELVDKLLKNNTLNFEEKLLKVYEFICLNYVYDVNVLYFRKENGVAFNKYIALFICAVLRQEKYRYSYGRKWVLESMKSTIIKLPEKSGKPDWCYMENYMKSLPYGDRI